jgi:hypothetical protein
MEDRDESPLAMAARHVMEGEEQVARQKAIVDRMLEAGYQREAAEAERLLQTMRTTLKLAHEHLRREESHGDAFHCRDIEQH